MKKLLLLLPFLFGCNTSVANENNSAASMADSQAASAQAEMAIGVNVDILTEASREHFFIDVFKNSRSWRLIVNGRVQRKDVVVPLDEEGFPDFSQMNPGEGAQSSCLINQSGNYFKGIYDVYYHGTGDVRLAGPSVTEVSREINGPGEASHIQIDVQGDRGLAVELFSSDASDPIRQIRVLSSDFGIVEDQITFRPELVGELRKYNHIRFGSWSNVNYTFGTFTKEGMTQTDDIRQSTFQPQGAAVEYMVELANQTFTDPWFNMPHLYTEEYVREHAQIVKDNLHAEAVIYVEFSNETWNSQFVQNKWALNLADDQGVPWPYVVADHAKIVWDIWLDVFSDDPSRIIRVLGGDAANTFAAQKFLEHLNGDIDAIAVASYFTPPRTVTALYDSNTTAQQIVDDAVSYVPVRVDFVKNHMDVIASMNLDIPVIIYEGGQGLISKQTWRQATYDAQLLPEMYDGTFANMNELAKLGVPIFTVFGWITDRTDPFGSWGHAEFFNQLELDRDDLRIAAPKMAAILDFIDFGSPSANKTRVDGLGRKDGRQAR